MDIDDLRGFWTRGLAGQDQCWEKPLDCQPGDLLRWEPDPSELAES